MEVEKINVRERERERRRRRNVNIFPRSPWDEYSYGSAIAFIF